MSREQPGQNGTGGRGTARKRKKEKKEMDQLTKVYTLKNTMYLRSMQKKVMASIQTTEHLKKIK